MNQGLDSTLARETSVGGARRGPRRRRWLVTAGLAVTVVVSFLLVGAGGPGSRDASAQVVKGALAPLSEHTVALSIDGTISASGQSIILTGSGLADLSSNIETTSLSFSVNGTPLQESVLVNGHTAYMQVLENGHNQIAQLLPGKHWVQVPLNVSSTSGLGASEPNILAQLQLLAAKGNTVVSLGTSTIDGEAVSGYQVTITRQALAAAYKRAEALSEAEAPAIKTMLDNVSFNPTVIEVWLDANHLLRRETVSISVVANGVSASGNDQIDFTDYGHPVIVSIPAQNDVASYSDFLSAAKSAG